MLRGAVLLLATAAAAAGSWLCWRGPRGPGIYLLVTGIVIFAGVRFERWRYRKSAPPAARWQPTGERFLDPQSGEDLEVQFDPASGERRYVRAGDRGPGR